MKIELLERSDGMVYDAYYNNKNVGYIIKYPITNMVQAHFKRETLCRMEFLTELDFQDCLNKACKEILIRLLFDETDGEYYTLVKHKDV